MSTKDLLLLTKGAKYITIFCFITLLYNSVSVSFMLNRQTDWAEIAYICAVNLAALWVMVKIERYLQRRSSLCN